MSFSWTQIAQIWACKTSLCIVGGWNNDGLLDTIVMGNITDAELMTVIEQIRRDLPTLGETMVWGHLKSMGFRVTRERVRHAIRETILCIRLCVGEVI